MSQREILHFLENNKTKWFYAAEICINIKSITPCSLLKSLKVLREYEEVYVKVVQKSKKSNTCYKYKHKNILDVIV